MTLRKRLHLSSLSLAAASLAAAGAMMPNPATAAVATCLGQTPTINMNVAGYPDTNRPANDIILGTPGDDTINGGGGGDYICAGAGNDHVNGGGENDIVDGGAGNDDLYGGDESGDSDWVVYYTRTVPVVASVDGTAKVGASETDAVSAFENIMGGTKDDTLTGNDENGRLYGGDGNDTLNGEGGDDYLVGDDDATPGSPFGNGAAGNGADTINGGSGIDTVDYGADHLGAVAVALSVAGASGNSTDGDAGSRDTVKGVEDVYGTKGNDRITGNTSSNHLYGYSGDAEGSGNDVLDGGKGDATDILDGGDGGDTVSYASHTKGVQVDFVSDKDNEGDTFGHVLRFVGSTHNDMVRDDASRAILLDGGAGVDTIDMSNHTQGVTVTFDGERNDGNAEDEAESGAGARDLIKNFENVVGTVADDKLTGDSKANTILGGPGDDKLYGQGGNDTLNGGPGADALSGSGGTDTADYSDRTDPNDPLVITLDGVANDGSATVDKLGAGTSPHDNVSTTVENVRAGAGNDTLTGSAAANVLYGGEGDDKLSGGDGNDTFRGDGGADVFIGSGGTDTVTYSDRTGSTSGVVVTIGTGTDDGSEKDASVNSESTARDDVRGSIENLIGGAGSDSLTGSSAANHLTGGKGVDKLYGLGGKDALSAKDGIKDGRLDGGTGTDTVSRDSIDPTPISVP